MISEQPRHEVSQQAGDQNRRRWLCLCGWATPWTFYTDPTHAADAVRHLINPDPVTVNGSLTADQPEANHPTAVPPQAERGPS